MIGMAGGDETFRFPFHFDKLLLEWLNWASIVVFRFRQYLFVIFLTSFALIFIYLFYFFHDSINSSSIYMTRNGNFIEYMDTKNLFPSLKNCPKTETFEKERQIFQSVRIEHIQLVKEFAEKKKYLESILLEIAQKESVLRELNLHIEQLRLIKQDLSDRRNVKISLPNAPIRFDLEEKEMKISFEDDNLFSNLETSIDYRRCSISSPFRFFLYLPEKPLAMSSSRGLFAALATHAFRVKHFSDACLFVVLVENEFDRLKSLAHWGDYGRNHLILVNNKFNKPMIWPNVTEIGAAIIVSADFYKRIYRFGMDIVVDLNIGEVNLTEYENLPQVLPYARQYLLSFSTAGISAAKKQSLETLLRSANASDDSFHFEFQCDSSIENNGSVRNENSLMDLCYDFNRRVALLKRTHFVLIFTHASSLQTRFREALLAGAIPVLVHHVGGCLLPFEDLIDWRLATLRLAESRLPELHFILRSIAIADLLEMRRKGRFFLEHYLVNTKVVTRAIISTMRYRLQMLADGVSTLLSHNISTTESLSTFVPTATRPLYDDEYLGPLEPSIPSFSYNHNFTSLQMFGYEIWNKLPHYIEFTPEFLESDVVFPSEAEFDEEASFGMRPIAPGSGQEFSLALGGNRQREQFTVVMATYNRDAVLNASLERLHRLPYLNKVLVVWNNVERPHNASVWPRIHVPIVFVDAGRNSLNNRFLPFPQIETEAILSLDDDMDLKQHEIVFAFRTWRENRHRIVGFPARYHARYGDDFFYNSNHTCQLSMILTGAAFLHKSYLHAYTHSMPEIIRRKVDDWMNCEDLAMNFLVSHLTRLPPIKTTSKWTLKCPMCPETLSDDASHFNERHICIRFFTRVYGYNPLLFSQVRVDSVLFKTRVPPNRQKCFRYV